jgi:ABC-2 type transport system permease protein
VYFVYAGIPAVEPFLRCWLAALLLGVSITGFTVGVSASSRTMNQAGLFAFLSFLVFFVFWRLIILRLYSSLDRFLSFPASRPEWVDILLWLNPLQAYFAVVSELAPNRTKGVEGFYASEWFGVAVLVGWIVVPLLIGLWQFGRNDL